MTNKQVDDVPHYLFDMVARPDDDDTHRRRDWVGRRCSRHLRTIWMGLQKYTNSPLTTPMEWDAAIDTIVLQRWYNRSVTAGPQHAIHNRWIRYTLNRLMLATGGGGGDHPRIIKHHGSRSNENVIPLRMSQFQDTIITHAIEGSARRWTARESYVLRRFVASFPIWDFHRMPGCTSPSAVRWWVQERMPLVVPQVHARWFPAALEALLAWFLPCADAVAAFQPPAGLLYPTSEGLDVGNLMPYHCAVFFRHYFQEGALDWVKVMARIFRFSGCTRVHIRQMWDECKDFWLFHCRGHGECFRTVVRPRIGETSVRDWLVDVYRRAGGGMRLTPVCIKALSSLRFMMQTDLFATFDLRIPSRPQYLGMVQHVCSREEPNRNIFADGESTAVVRNQRAFPAGRTYRDEECQRLLAACTTYRDRLLMLLLQRVALRNTALRTLRLCNLCDPTTGLVRGVCEAAEKGGTTRRFCLDPETVTCLMEYIHKEHPLSNAVASNTTAWVFPRSVTELDTCISPSQMHWWFKKQCQAAKITGPHCTIHQFRHYVVTKLMANGSNRIEDVSMWLGHTSVHTTCAHYWIIDVSDLHRRLVFPWATHDK